MGQGSRRGYLKCNVYETSFTPPLMIGDSCTIIVSACEVIVASSFPLVGKLPRAPADDLFWLLQASELFRLLGFIEIVDVTLLGVKLIFLKCLRFYVSRFT